MDAWKLPEPLRGVDLSLDTFDLSEPTRATPALTDAITCGGKAFWSNISSASESAFTDEERGLLRDIFNPHLSDRREESDRFVLPDTSTEYLQKLQDLIKEEGAMRQERAEHFFSKDFVMESAGSLFPSSWVSSCGITQEGQNVAPSCDGTKGQLLHAHPDFQTDASKFEQLLKSTIPIFNKCTEDGMRFRIYKAGNIEVRTTQEHDSEEVIGAVFSCRAPTQVLGTGEGLAIKQHESIVKVTQYVEKIQGKTPKSMQLKKESKTSLADFHFYVVFETESGNIIVTEKLGTTATWAENPPNLEARNSLARITRSIKSCSVDITVKNIKNYQANQVHCENGSCSPNSSNGSKRYAQGICSLVQPVRKLN